MSAQSAYRFLPLVNSEASLLVAIFAFLLVMIGFGGEMAVYFWGFDITNMAYVSFWVFDVCMFGMLLTVASACRAQQIQASGIHDRNMGMDLRTRRTDL